MASAREIILACWIIFLGYWLISSFFAKKTVYRQRFGAEMKYRLPTVIGAILLFKSPELGRHSHTIIPYLPIIEWGSAVLAVLGLAFACWARWTLSSNWSATVTLKADHELIERGPYQFVRHPIYTGMLMMLFASVLIVGNLVAIVAFVILIYGFTLKLKQEERVMIEHFAFKYIEYRTRVKAVIPFLI